MNILAPIALAISWGFLVAITHAHANYDALRNAYDRLDLSSAQFLLATIYRDGDGVEANMDKAVHWYLRAASQGVPEAQVEIGLLYHRGEGVKQSYTTALYWFRQAAKKQFPQGENNIGTMYDLGQGVKQDHAEAAYWYRRAAKKGLPDAQFNLGALREYGLGVARDVSHAYTLYAQSALGFSSRRQAQAQAERARDRTGNQINAVELAKLREIKRSLQQNSSNIQREDRGDNLTAHINSDSKETGRASNIFESPQYIGRFIQYPLATLGYSPGPIDQQLGPKTQAAIRAFQADYDLAITGQPNKSFSIELLGAVLNHWTYERKSRDHFRF